MFDGNNTYTLSKRKSGCRRVDVKEIITCRNT